MPTSEQFHDVTHRLLKTTLFAGLAEDAVRDMVSHGKEPPEIKEGKVFWAKGHAPGFIGVILRGRVEVRRGPLVFRRLEQDVLGITSALVDVPFSADLASAPDTAVRLFWIPTLAVRQFVQREPPLSARVIERLAERMSVLTDEIEDLRVLDARCRLAKRLRQLASPMRESEGSPTTLSVDMGTAYAFAELVHTSPGKLSGYLKEFAEASLIARANRSNIIRILDLDGLQDIEEGRS